MQLRQYCFSFPFRDLYYITVTRSQLDLVLCCHLLQYKFWKIKEIIVSTTYLVFTGYDFELTCIHFDSIRTTTMVDSYDDALTLLAFLDPYFMDFNSAQGLQRMATVELSHCYQGQLILQLRMSFVHSDQFPLHQAYICFQIPGF